ncbi:nuclear transport factor 2 family protein [Streptomyces sp. NPDC058773]|uniref:nuclear transport factor 2 family protein n=1 Tax=Streptomyces sp. NPDC058773 TaxID=3346632 RepID=UPI0036943A22
MSSARSFTDLYVAVQQFYAIQMRMLDEGDFEGYAHTFTSDGEFTHTPGRPPARTPGGIVKELVDFHKKFEGNPVQRRHWFNMLALTENDDDTLESTVYALVLTSGTDRVPEVAPSCTVHDVLVHEAGRLKTRSRTVGHDYDRTPKSGPATLT